LTDHGDISTLRKGFHEGLSTRLSDSTEICDKLLFGHTNTSVYNGEGVGGFIGDDFDFEVWFVLGDFWVSKGFVSDFIEGIRCVGDKFSEEDFFVGVESVNDETHQLLDISIEGEVLSVFLSVFSHFLKDIYINQIIC
jgi:hypothetical protein